MDSMLFILVMFLNVGISTWNCYAIGMCWKDVMALGSGFEKLLVWSAVIQSTVGFSLPVLLLLTKIAFWSMTFAQEPMFSAEESEIIMKGIFSFWWLLVIFPVLGSGLAIWAHSVREAYLRRDFKSIAIAGWNTFAEVTNAISAFRNMGGALGDVSEFFSLVKEADGVKGKVIAFFFVLVIISLVAGYMIAIGLVKYFAEKSESRMEQYARHLAA